MTGRYGRRPNDPTRPRIRLGRSLTGAVPSAPAAADYLRALGGGWQMLGNDEYGDCVAVTWANERRLVTATLTASPAYPGLAQVETFYKTQNPRFPADDNGMDIQTALGDLVKVGGPDGVKALGFAAVDYTNPAEVKAAIAVFGSLWVGIVVQDAQQRQFSEGVPWDYIRGSADDGGHSVIVGGYGAPGDPSPQLGGDEKFVTWAQETSFTDAYWSREVEECWAVIWPEHLGSRGFLAGVDLTQFAADYTAITGQPFPAVPVPPDPIPPMRSHPDLAFGHDPEMLAWAAAPHTGADAYAADQYNAWRQARHYN